MNPDINSPQAQQITTPQPNGHRKYVIVLVIILILALCGVTGMYVLQHDKLDDSLAQNSKLNSQLESAKKTQSSSVSNPSSAKESVSSDTNDQIVTGQVDFDQSNLRGQAGIMYVEAYIKPSGDLKEIWLEYGTSFHNLNLQSEHLTKELSLGEANSYSNFTFTIKKDSLKPGTNYFYRIAAQTNSATTYSGIAVFTSRK